MTDKNLLVNMMLVINNRLNLTQTVVIVKIFLMYLFTFHDFRIILKRGIKIEQ